MSGTDSREPSQSQRRWLQHLEACEAAGKTMREYAAEAGIAVSSLYGAKKRLTRAGLIGEAREVTAVTFARASIATPAASQYRISLANGITVSFSGTVNGATLTTVLRAAAALG